MAKSTSIRELASEKLETIGASDTAQHAAKKMRDKNVGSLIVVDRADKPVGIITEHDLVEKICATGARSSDVFLNQIMSFPLITIDVNSTIQIVADTMINNNVRHLLVMDSDRAVGIISSTDFRSYLKQHVDLDEVYSAILDGLSDRI